MIILTAFLPLLAFLAYHIRHFQMDASADTLLSKSDENYIKSQIYYNRYQPSEFILIAVQPKKTDSIFSTDTLTMVSEISNRLSKIPRVESVNSIVNAPIFYAASNFNQSTRFADLTWEKKKFDKKFLEKVLASHPIYENLLVSEDQKSLAIQVVFKTSPDVQELDQDIIAIRKQLLSGPLSEKKANRLKQLDQKRSSIRDDLGGRRKIEIEKIRDLLQDYDHRARFYLGGDNLLAYQLIKIIKNDLFIFGTAILLLVCLSLFFLFRSMLWVVMPLISCIVSVASTLGLLGFLGLKVTVISAHVISLQIILSLALILHLIEKYRILAESGDDKVKDIVSEMVKQKIKPCFYAGLTTSIGFGALIFSGVQPVISFGYMMVLAMGITIVVSLLFFPCTLILVANYLEAPKKLKFFSLIMEASNSLVTKYSGWIFTLTGLACAFGIAGCFYLTAENSFLNYFSKSTRVYKELSFIDQKFGGTTPLDLIYKIPQSEKKTDILVSASVIQDLEKWTRKFSEKEAIGSVTSLSDFTRVAQVVRNKPMSEYELTAFYDLLDESTKNKFVGSYFSEDKSELRISMRVQDATKGLDREKFMKILHEDMKNFGVSTDHYEFTSLFVLYQKILAKLVDSQFLTMSIVYCAMFFVLLFIFSSFKIALIALIPNIVTNLIIFGIMGFGGIALDLMTMTITSVATGMSMDDTIHYIHQFIKERGRSGEVILRTNHSVGYALFYSSFVILVGFGSLMFSEFVPSILFGALTGIAMILAFVADMTILPALLHRFCRSEKSGL